MEIKSIKEIESIWTFANFTNGSSFRFEKLTFIYWLNTFWKTTLTDIFQSLKYDNPNFITNRKTIPNQTWNQKVILNIKESNSEKELKFESSIWQSNSLAQQLEIFWSAFVHKNLFTWYSIERENKENFTEFILWEEWVKLSESIKNDNKILWDKNRLLKTNLPKFIQWKSDKEINDFIKTKIEWLDKIKNKKKLLILKIQKQDEENRLKEPQKILLLNDLSEILIPEYKVLDNIKNINLLFQKDYTDIKEEFLNKLNKHINWNFINKDGAENWIKQWFKNIKDKSWTCIFCWQWLDKANDILELYDKYFDDNYSKYILEIEENLDQEIDNIEKIDFWLLTNIQNQYSTSLKYKDLVDDKGFQQLLIDFDDKIKNINEKGLNYNKKKLLNLIKEKVVEKNKKPYKILDRIDFLSFQKEFNTYIKLISEINEIIKNIQIKVANFKEQYKDTSKISKKIDDLKIEIEKLEYLEVRLEWNSKCIKYLQEKENINNLKKTIEENKKKLKDEQNNYLQIYFKKINELFKKFWSHDFSLEKVYDNKWYKPVYYLKVNFHNQEITNEQMKTVFSESDRRALALAIFWAKIELKSQEEKSKTIVILDDPMTSFDEWRILWGINYFKNILNSLSQIIILTHYPNFIKIFCEQTKEGNITTKFLKIDKNNITSSIAIDERKNYTESQYEKIFIKIHNFINRKHSDCIKMDLRKFLENLYLPTLFTKQLIIAKEESKDISSLEKMIDVIFSEDTINKRFHWFRTSLNPDSHIFTTTNEEDIRNFAKDMMEYLYSFEFSKT